jgi:ubiquitin C-terminal hydrolase
MASKFHQKFLEFPEVIGLTRIGNSCFINSTLQFLYSIPDVCRFMAKPLLIDATLKKPDESVQNFNNFIKLTEKALLEMSNRILKYKPEQLIKLPFFKNVSSPMLLILSFLSNEAQIGLFIEGSHERIINIPFQVPFSEIISSIENGTLGIISIFYISRFDGPDQLIESEFDYKLPLEFSHQSGVYLLKAVICHLPNHWITYVRRGFSSKFMEIDDDSICFKPINNKRSYLALYLQVPSND